MGKGGERGSWGIAPWLLGDRRPCKQILMKFFGGVGHGPWTNFLDLSYEPHHDLDPGIF